MSRRSKLATSRDPLWTKVHERLAREKAKVKAPIARVLFLYDQLGELRRLVAKAREEARELRRRMAQSPAEWTVERAKMGRELDELRLSVEQMRAMNASLAERLSLQAAPWRESRDKAMRLVDELTRERDEARRERDEYAGQLGFVVNGP